MDTSQQFKLHDLVFILRVFLDREVTDELERGLQALALPQDYSSTSDEIDWNYLAYGSLSNRMLGIAHSPDVSSTTEGKLEEYANFFLPNGELVWGSIVNFRYLKLDWQRLQGAIDSSCSRDAYLLIDDYYSDEQHPVKREALMFLRQSLAPYLGTGIKNWERSRITLSEFINQRKILLVGFKYLPEQDSLERTLSF